MHYYVTHPCVVETVNALAFVVGPKWTAALKGLGFMVVVGIDFPTFGVDSIKYV